MKQEHPTIASTCSIKDAMQVIDDFEKGICYVLQENRLIGVLTDGDIRRALLGSSSINDQVDSVMNRDFVSYPIETDSKIIRERFSKRIRFIPLVDQNGLFVDVADPNGNFRIPVLEPVLGENELHNVIECIETNWISSQGRFVRKFEDMFTDHHEGMYALAVSNGTVALQLAMEALGIKDGDEVLIPNITFAATANAVIACGGNPVLCEIDSKTWCIDTNEAEKLISSKTKAIIPVHLYGQPCAMQEIVKLAQEHDLIIIEDCAEALGSKYGDQYVGTFGQASTYSFFGNKTITTGEGGMILFSDQRIWEEAKVLRDHGMCPNKRYWHETVGYNFRLTNLQAAVGVAQMERLESILRKKIEIAGAYYMHLRTSDAIAQLPFENPDNLHSHWLFGVLLKEGINREKIVNELLRKGIDTRNIFYPLSTMKPYAKYRKSINLKVSEDSMSQGILLPSSVNLTLEKIKEISEAFLETLKNH